MKQSQPIVRVSRPSQGSRLPSITEAWAFRHMLWQLVRRDFKTRYMQSVLGILWIVITPIVTMIVYTFVFKRIADVPSYDIPYPVFSFAAIVPWGFFTRGVSLGSKSVIANQQLIKDVYVPRILIPFSTQFTGIMDMLINFGVFLILMFIFGIVPPAQSIFVIFFLVLMFMLTVGISFFLSALQVRFRDIGQLVGFAIQIMFFLTPVAYPSGIVQEPFRMIYGLNPMVGILDGWRWAMLGTDSLYLPHTVASVVITLVVFVVGILYYSHAEKTFVDWI